MDEDEYLAEYKGVIGALIEAARQKAGLTQLQLAERIGRTEKTIYNYERTGNVRMPDLRAIEEALLLEPFSLDSAATASARRNLDHRGLQSDSAVPDRLPTATATDRTPQTVGEVGPAGGSEQVGVESTDARLARAHSGTNGRSSDTAATQRISTSDDLTTGPDIEDDKRVDGDNAAPPVEMAQRRNRWPAVALVTSLIVLGGYVAYVVSQRDSPASEAPENDPASVEVASAPDVTEEELPDETCAAQVGFVPAALGISVEARDEFVRVAEENGVTCAEEPVAVEPTPFGDVIYQEVDAPGTTERPAGIYLMPDGQGVYLDTRTWRIIKEGVTGLQVETTRKAAFGPLIAIERYEDGRLYRFASGHGISHLGSGAGPSVFLIDVVMAAWDANGGYETVGLATGDPHSTEVPDGSFLRQDFTRGFLHARGSISDIVFEPAPSDTKIQDWDELQGHIISTMSTPRASWVVVGDRELAWIPNTGAFGSCGGDSNRVFDQLPGAALEDATVVGEIRGDDCKHESP